MTQTLYKAVVQRIWVNKIGYAIGVVDIFLFVVHVGTLISGNLYTGHYCNSQYVLTAIHIHRSESPSQVFLIVIQWLHATLQNIPVEKWSEIVIAYDAMCKLDGMKVCSQPLPLPEPFDKMWMTVRKVCGM